MFFKGPSNIKLSSKIITIVAYEDVNAGFSDSVENLVLFLNIDGF